MGEFSLQRCNTLLRKLSQSHQKTEIATLSRRFAHDLGQNQEFAPKNQMVS